MSGHKRAFGLSKPQNGTALEGGFLDIVSGTPSNSTSGFSKGALAIDTQNGKLYINEGTIQSTTWTEVTGSGGAEHIYSKPTVAATVASLLKSGTANLMVIGDSISNAGSTAFDTFHKGVLEHFKPDNWRGVFFDPPGGIDATGSGGIHRINQNGGNTGSPGDSSYMLGTKGVSNDGAIDSFVANLDHEIAGGYELTAFDDARTNNITTFEIAQEALTGLLLDANVFPNHSRDKLFENSSGVVDFFEPAKLGTTTAGARLGIIFLTSDAPQSGFTFATALRSRMYLNNDFDDDIGAGTTFNNFNLTSPSGITEEVKYRGVDWDKTDPIAFDGGGNITNNRLRFTLSQSSTGSGGDDRLLCVVGGFIGYEDSERTTGLRVSSITRGGAETGNFLLEPGDAGIPLTSGNVPFAFTDAALSRRIKVTETNVVMIHIGANDNTVKGRDSASYDPAAYVSSLDSMMDRIQTAASTALLPPVKFLVIGQYNPVYNGYVVGLQTYSQAEAEAQHDNYADINSRIIVLTKERTDMVYFDTEAYLNTTAYNTEGYATGEPTVMQLTAGYNDPSDDDNVHLNALGVDTIMSGLWSKLSSLAT